jgi:hypothetical protein
LTSGELALGISGAQAAVGDHICGLYAGREQRDKILTPFLETGLASGDKCICVVDGTNPDEIVGMLGADVDARASADSKQLEVIRSVDMYLRSGAFSAHEVIASWKATMSDVMYDGRFGVVRAAETWSKRDVVPDPMELLLLESEMNRYLPLYPQVILCLYDLDRFGAGIIVDLLKTHPRVLIGGLLVDNPYHQTPDELLTGTTQRRDGATEAEIEEAASWYSDATTGST